MFFSMRLLIIHKISYYKVRVSTGGVETRWLGWQFHKVGLGIWEFCAISRRLIWKIRFPHPTSVADAICGTRFDLRDSKR